MGPFCPNWLCFIHQCKCCAYNPDSDRHQKKIQSNPTYLIDSGNAKGEQKIRIPRLERHQDKKLRQSLRQNWMRLLQSVQDNVRFFF